VRYAVSLVTNVSAKARGIPTPPPGFSGGVSVVPGLFHTQIKGLSSELSLAGSSRLFPVGSPHACEKTPVFLREKVNWSEPMKLDTFRQIVNLGLGE
jgi:hypothetical protein